MKTLTRTLLALLVTSILIGCGPAAKNRYTSDPLKMSFNYPEGWRIIEDENSVVLSTMEGIDTLDDVQGQEKLDGTIISLKLQSMTEDDMVMFADMTGVPIDDFVPARVELAMSQMMASVSFEEIEQSTISTYTAAKASTDMEFNRDSLVGTGIPVKTTIGFIYDEEGERMIELLAFDTTKLEDEAIQTIFDSIELEPQNVITMNTFESDTGIVVDYPEGWMAFNDPNGVVISNVEGITSLDALTNLEGTAFTGTIVGILGRDTSAEEAQSFLDFAGGAGIEDFPNATVGFYFNQLGAPVDKNLIRDIIIGGITGAKASSPVFLGDGIEVKATIGNAYDAPGKKSYMIIGFDSTQLEDRAITKIIKSIRLPQLSKDTAPTDVPNEDA